MLIYLFAPFSNFILNVKRQFMQSEWLVHIGRKLANWGQMG